MISPYKRLRSDLAERTPPPGQPRPFLNWSRVETLAEDGYPTEFYDHLACPFRKHDPKRYRFVKSACTEGWGFPNIGKLNEHINRVHTAKFRCNTCSHRFTVTKDDSSLERHKEKHKSAACKPRQLDERTDPEVMTPKQEAAWSQTDCRSGQGRADQQKWKDMIYLCLFPDTPPEQIPSPYHRPGLCPIEWLSQIVPDTMDATSLGCTDAQAPHDYQPIYQPSPSYNGLKGFEEISSMESWMTAPNAPMRIEDVSSRSLMTYVPQPARTHPSHLDHGGMHAQRQDVGGNPYGLSLASTQPPMAMMYSMEDMLGTNPGDFNQQVPYVIPGGPASGVDSGIGSDGPDQDPNVPPMPHFQPNRFPCGDDDGDDDEREDNGDDLGGAGTGAQGALRSIGSGEEQALRRVRYGLAAGDDLEVSDDED